MRLRLVLAFSFLAIQLATPSQAIVGGKSALQNPYVVGLLRGQFATSSGCSGALVAPQIVFTAAHCLGGPAQNFWVAQPGSDLRDTQTLRIQVREYKVPRDFSSARFPYSNDFGVLILESPFPGATPLKIASSDQVAKWMNEEAAVLHVGYGCTELVDAPPCKETSPVPNQLETTLLKRVPQQFAELRVGTYSLTKISVERSICGGDSGSPLLRNQDGDWIYVGAQSSSNGAGCTKTCNEICAASQGLPSANPELLEQIASFLNLPAQVVKPNPTITVSAKPTFQAPSKKKITITCTKGRTVKRVTGTNPKCPAGYRK